MTLFFSFKGIYLFIHIWIAVPSPSLPPSLVLTNPSSHYTLWGEGEARLGHHQHPLPHRTPTPGYQVTENWVHPLPLGKEDPVAGKRERERNTDDRRQYCENKPMGTALGNATCGAVTLAVRLPACTSISHAYSKESLPKGRPSAENMACALSWRPDKLMWPSLSTSSAGGRCWKQQ